MEEKSYEYLDHIRQQYLDRMGEIMRISDSYFPTHEREFMTGYLKSMRDFEIINAVEFDELVDHYHCYY